MLARQTQDWWEWIELYRARLRQGYVQTLYTAMGKAQDPPQRHPKGQAPHYDEHGYVRLPAGWARAELTPIQLRVLPMGQGGPPYGLISWPIAVVGPRFGQDVFERAVCGLLPDRLPEPPFAGVLLVEFRHEGRRLWAHQAAAEVGWTWPQARR